MKEPENFPLKMNEQPNKIQKKEHAKKGSQSSIKPKIDNNQSEVNNFFFKRKGNKF